MSKKSKKRKAQREDLGVSLLKKHRGDINGLVKTRLREVQSVEDLKKFALSLWTDETIHNIQPLLQEASSLSASERFILHSELASVSFAVCVAALFRLTKMGLSFSFGILKSVVDCRYKEYYKFDFNDEVTERSFEWFLSAVTDFLEDEGTWQAVSSRIKYYNELETFEFNEEDYPAGIPEQTKKHMNTKFVVEIRAFLTDTYSFVSEIFDNLTKWCTAPCVVAEFDNNSDVHLTYDDFSEDDEVSDEFVAKYGEEANEKIKDFTEADYIKNVLSCIQMPDIVNRGTYVVPVDDGKTKFERASALVNHEAYIYAKTIDTGIDLTVEFDRTLDEPAFEKMKKRFISDMQTDMLELILSGVYPIHSVLWRSEEDMLATDVDSLLTMLESTITIVRRLTWEAFSEGNAPTAGGAG